MSKNSSLPSQEQQETSELNGSGGRRGKGIRGPGPFVLVGGSNWDKRLRGPFVPVGATNRDKRPPFCPGWCLQPGQKAHVPPLARQAIGPGTKVTYCLGPKDSRNKWSRTKTYFVVVPPIPMKDTYQRCNHGRVVVRTSKLMPRLLHSVFLKKNPTIPYSIK